VADDAEHVHARGVGSAENFNNLSSGSEAAVGPFVETDEDFFAGLGLEFLRPADNYVVAETRIVGYEVRELSSLVESADNFEACTFENAQHTSGGRFIGPPTFQSDEDVIVGQGGGAITSRNGQGRYGISVREEGAIAFTIEADASGNEIGIFRQGVAVAFEAYDAAVFFQLLEQSGKCGAFLEREA
jgi:hypothetical protein